MTNVFESKNARRQRQRDERAAAMDAEMAEEARHRREEPTSQERMVDKLNSIILNNTDNDHETLAEILRCHISGEEYFP